MNRARILALIVLVLIATALRAVPAEATATPATHANTACGCEAQHTDANGPAVGGTHEAHQVAGGECTRCGGNKKCSVCNGSGKNNSGDTCSICNGSGDCYYCGGSGKSS